MQHQTVSLLGSYNQLRCSASLDRHLSVRRIRPIVQASRSPKPPNLTLVAGGSGARASDLPQMHYSTSPHRSPIGESGGEGVKEQRIDEPWR